MSLHVSNDVRRAINQMRDLMNGGCLTPERLDALTKRALAGMDEVDEYLEHAAPVHDEKFEVTAAGVIALYVNGKPARWRGHLAVIDGDRA